MRHLPRDANFIAKPDQRGFADGRGRQKLESDGLVEDQVEGFVDLAHSTSAEQSQNAIASCQYHACGKAAFFRRARGRRRTIQNAVKPAIGCQDSTATAKQV